MNNTLKWFHVITKTIVHCLLGTIEYIGIPFLLAYCFSYIVTFFDKRKDYSMTRKPEL